MIFCSALTVWVRKGFNSIMAPWKVNSFTFPFVFCTWIFVICARLFSNMPPEFMGTPELPDNITFTSGTLTFGLIVEYWLKGIAQVFLINSWVTGILFLIGLALCSRWAAFWAAAGSAISLALAIAFGAPMDDYAQGLYGFSGVLTAIALGCTFYKPNARSAVWAVTGIIATFFIQAAMNVMFTPLGLPSFTAPFCVATWLFLLPQFKLDSDKDEVDNSEWGKKHVK